ncbi:MAG TPA: UDP-N-acetylmuramoyl-L-alanine--D-glutamate ligase, partial [bacterium]|nr:UDP-N-acetylmuramoyl-L-alanine--D-glutamate ligase [bacterium]
MSVNRVQDTIDRLKGKNIHVVGFGGTEGAAVVDFLAGRGITTITAHELHPQDGFTPVFDRTHQWLPADQRAGAAQRVLGYPITYQWKDRYLEGIDRADIIFVPQSWFRYSHNAPVRQAQQREVPLSSMTQLFFEVAPCPIIGVTGTNGKFTVAYLIEQMLRTSGLRTYFSGNDRSHVPMLYYVDEIPPEAWLVLEISNRQLVGLPYSPDIAVITNIAPHHLDDHGTMEAYVATKRTILDHQSGDDRAVLNADDERVAALAAVARHPYLFSRTQRLERGAYLADGRLVIAGDQMEQSVPRSVLQVPGAHMIENALAACLAASLAGSSAPAMAEVLSEFRGLPYRFRVVAEINGVRYIEDSLATNPAAAAGAIASMDRPFVLIAGGARPRASAEDFLPIQKALAAAPARAVLLIGATAPHLGKALESTAIPVHQVSTL